MSGCKHNDCGWCYASEPQDDCHVQEGTNKCLGYNFCKRYANEVSKPTMEVWEALGASVVIDKTVRTDKHTARKQRPLYSGLLKYFPDALMEVAHCSWLGNEQHNPGSPLHWDRSKSADELDALMLHMLCIDEKDDDGVYQAVKVAWRALAYLQKLLEQDG